MSVSVVHDAVINNNHQDQDRVDGLDCGLDDDREDVVYLRITNQPGKLQISTSSINSNLSGFLYTAYDNGSSGTGELTLGDHGVINMRCLSVCIKYMELCMSLNEGRNMDEVKPGSQILILDKSHNSELDNRVIQLVEDYIYECDTDAGTDRTKVSYLCDLVYCANYLCITAFYKCVCMYIAHHLKMDSIQN